MLRKLRVPRIVARIRDRLRSDSSRCAKPLNALLVDASFLGALPSSSDAIVRGKQAYAQGDHSTARRSIVEHFVSRQSPRFFCDYGRIPELAARARCEFPHWTNALLTRVDDDRTLGLRIMSARYQPLRPGFDWSGAPVGPGRDDLYRAQPHRFGFMPQLACAGLHGVDTLGVIADLIDGWITATRAGDPESYHSQLLVLYRVVALTWTFAYVAALKPVDITQQIRVLFSILKIIWEDSEYLKPMIGTSYANNHLLADGFAGWYVGTLFPEFDRDGSMLSRGEQIFEPELLRQFHTDGSNFEHSMHYHELGCEMAVTYCLLRRRNAVPTLPAIEERLHAMLAFQAAIGGGGASPLHLGDTTEDPIFPLDAMRGWAVGAMREFCRALFEPRLAPTPVADLTVERAYWLLGGELAARPLGSPEPAPPTDFFDGGLHVLDDSVRHARLTFRSGPPPHAPISAGHAHADILSPYLDIAGVPLIIDAGTFTYRFAATHWIAGTPGWRSYLAGPQAHNGPCTDSDPYGSMRGDFRNRDVPCRVQARQCVRGDTLSWIEFEVAGQNDYAGWRRGVVHVLGEYWLIYDLPVPGVVERGARISLQFAPDVKVTTIGADRLTATSGTSVCTVARGAGLGQPRIHFGDLKPLAGWVSLRYGEIKPAPQVRIPISKEAGCCAFLIRATAEGHTSHTPISFAAQSTTSDRIAISLRSEDHIDVISIPMHASVPEETVWGLPFGCKLGWVRKHDHAILERRDLQPSPAQTVAC